MMPLSISESSSVNENSRDCSPNRKLVTMNARSCRLSGCMANLREVVDEAVDEDLRRENREQRHAVAGPCRAAGAELLHEVTDGLRLEDAVAPHLCRRQ